MTLLASQDDFTLEGYSPNLSASLSLKSDAHTDPRSHEVDMSAILAKTSQGVCHVDKGKNPDDCVAAEIGG